MKVGGYHKPNATPPTLEQWEIEILEKRRVTRKLRVMLPVHFPDVYGNLSDNNVGKIFGFSKIWP